MLWIRTAVRGEPWILSEKISFLISAASFTLNLLPRAKRQHGIYETCVRCRKCDYGLSISLSILSTPYPRQEWRGRAPPQTGGLLLSLIFLTPVFTFPFNPCYSILPPHSSCFALSALLLPLQHLSFSAVSISLPRAQRQFSRSGAFFSLSLTFSHNRLRLRLIFTNSRHIRAIWSDSGGLMEGSKQKSQKRGKLRGTRKEGMKQNILYINTLHHTCVRLHYYMNKPNNTI